jgi:hypothetical protein
MRTKCWYLPDTNPCLAACKKNKFRLFTWLVYQTKHFNLSFDWLVLIRFACFCLWYI